MSIEVRSYLYLRSLRSTSVPIILVELDKRMREGGTKRGFHTNLILVDDGKNKEHKYTSPKYQVLFVTINVAKLSLFGYFVLHG